MHIVKIVMEGVKEKNRCTEGREGKGYKRRGRPSGNRPGPTRAETWVGYEVWTMTMMRERIVNKRDARREGGRKYKGG